MKTFPDWARLPTTTLIALTLVTAVVATTSQHELALTADCSPDGLTPKLRAVAQGRRFWRGQLDYLDERVAWVEAGPQRQAEAAEMRAARRAREELQRQAAARKHPELAPSELQQEAYALRDQGEELQSMAHDLQMQDALQAWARQLLICRPVVATRAGVRQPH
jgi:hypothetical protein